MVDIHKAGFDALLFCASAPPTGTVVAAIFAHSRPKLFIVAKKRHDLLIGTISQGAQKAGHRKLSCPIDSYPHDIVGINLVF